MRAITVLDKSPDFKRLLNVFEKSWAEHHDIPLEVIYMPGTWDRKYLRGLWMNTIKLEKWAENFTDDTVFLDADMLCTGNILDAFDKFNHVAYTKNTHPNRILNAGVFFAKYSDYSVDFMQEWVDTNRKMLNCKIFHTPWRRKYQGINQAALGYMLENGWDATPLDDSYNLCHWVPGKIETAKMLHIKGKLRTAVLCGTREHAKIRKLWKSYEN